jgi:hypothetical protein
LDAKLASLNWTALYSTSEDLLQSALSFTDAMDDFLARAHELGGFQGMWQKLAQAVPKLTDSNGKFE